MLGSLFLAASLQMMRPADYILSKFADHRVVILGESHWVRQETELARDVVPRLRAAGVSVFAFEMLGGQIQPRIDALVNGPEWTEGEATALLRTAAWPYREYRDILHAVWEANRGGAHLRLIALQPDDAARERRESYDAYAAQRVLDAIGTTGRAFVYCGLHHGFTRFVQPWMPQKEKVDGFFDRMGNFLRRAIGEDAFLVATHRPWQCRVNGKWTYCLPLDGAIDCAMQAPGGFDIATSPFAESLIAPNVWYAMGTPMLRFVDFSDGYVRLEPIERLDSVHLIPLKTFAPDAAALDEVRRNNPFADSTTATNEELEHLWAKEERSLADFLSKRKWSHLAGWRKQCR